MAPRIAKQNTTWPENDFIRLRQILLYLYLKLILEYQESSEGSMLLGTWDT